MKGIELYGKDWKKVQQLVGTRTSAQSRSHAQKVLSKAGISGQDDSTFATPKSPVREKEVNMKCIELPLDNNVNMPNNIEQNENEMNYSAENKSEDYSIENRKRGVNDRDNDFDNIPRNIKRK